MRGADASAPRLQVGGPGARGEETATADAVTPVAPVPRRRRAGHVSWFGRRRARRGQRGMATVEFAIGLVTLVLLVSALVGIVLLGVSQSGIQTVSSELAKHLARGDDALAEKTKEKAPKRARIEVERAESGVRVTTRLDVSILHVGAIPLEATAWAHWEPGVGP